MRRKVDQRQGQQPIHVRDRAAEVGVNLNTVFTALVLAGILWVGTTLESIKETLNKSAVTQAVMQRDADNLRRDLSRHVEDPLAHSKMRKDK